MKLSQLAFLCPLILLPVSSYGETTFPAIGASSTSTAKPTTHTVIVGGQFGNLTYEPMNTLANPGDEMLFLMRAKNHSGATLVLVFCIID
jgi:plastocyanin